MPTKLPLLGGGERDRAEMILLAESLERTACELRLAVEKHHAPTPPYAERLIEAVRAGEFQLPIEDSEYTQLRYEADAGRKSWAWWDREWQVTRHIIPQTSGRPPKWQPGDPTEIDLQPIRDALKERARATRTPPSPLCC